jgi:hypothetical protein
MCAFWQLDMAYLIFPLSLLSSWVQQFCCSPQVSGGSGTPDQIVNDEIRIARLHGTFPPQPSANATAPSPGDSADEGLIPCFPHRAALVFCDGDAEVSLCAPVFLALTPPPPLLLCPLNLPCRLAAMADALLSMVNFDLLRRPGTLFDTYTLGSLPPVQRL